MEKIIEILIAEDDQLDVIDIRRSLDKMHILYNLHVAKNGEEALEKLDEKTFVPDFVLIDINMPKMNGLELLASLRNDERHKDLKCFIITTSDDTTDKDIARKLGVSGYIIKPLKINSPSSIDAFNFMIDLMNMKTLQG